MLGRGQDHRVVAHSALGPEDVPGVQGQTVIKYVKDIHIRGIMLVVSGARVAANRF